MRYTRLGRSDLNVSAIALGCGSFGGLGSVRDQFGRGLDKAQSFDLLDAAYEAGITLFDTANSYGGGRSEEWIGDWMADRRSRESVVLATKAGGRFGVPNGVPGLSPPAIRRQLDDSLRRLRSEYVDLYLVHGPALRTPIDETLGGFDELVAEGKVRYVGLCNYTKAQLTQALETADRLELARPVNLQCRYNLFDQSSASTFDACIDRGVGFSAHSPLHGGWLGSLYRRGQPYPPASAMAVRPDTYKVADVDEMFDVAERLSTFAMQRATEPASAALAWALSNPAVATVIVGPNNPAELLQAVAALEIRLSDAELAALSGMVSAIAGGGGADAFREVVQRAEQ